jgi:hypothetical protein
MATVLDLGLIRAFDVIFPVILVWALVFALLQKSKAISENPSINAIIAVAAAFMILLSDAAIDIINFIMPWFTVAIIFFTLLLLIFYVFGLKDDQLSAVVSDKGVYWTLIGVGIIIILAALGNVFGQELTEQSFVDSDGNTINIDRDAGVATGNHEQNLVNTLFHPSVLALMLLFGIAIFTTFLLTG